MSFQTGNLREFDIAWDGDSYQIPDIQLHPYTEQHDKLQPVKKSFKSTAKSTKKSTAKSPAKIAVKSTFLKNLLALHSIISRKL